MNNNNQIVTISGEKFRKVLQKKLGFDHEKKEVSPTIRNGEIKTTPTMLVLHAHTGNTIVPSSIINEKRSQKIEEKKRKNTLSTIESDSPNSLKPSKTRVDQEDLV